MTKSEQDMRVPAPSKAGWPNRYFAVIFTAQRTLSDKPELCELIVKQIMDKKNGVEPEEDESSEDEAAAE